jgi:acyl carrier protein
MSYKKYFVSHCVFVTTLGLTEAGPVCMYFIDKDAAITDPVVPVGYELEDMEVLLLDEAGKEVARGEVGEILVKSRFLAAEYWHKPERTHAAFLPDPTGGDCRLYRTGDLGRVLPDGCLVHLGRTDFQVKIRGNRIAVTEVEMALLRLDSVQEAVVVAREAQPGEHRLIAYLTPRSSPPPSVTTLRNALSATLPDYMMPSVFMWLEALPRLATGKVDRQALPELHALRPELATPFVPPRTPIEEKLVTLWAELLRLDQVGIHDDFFALGGHSLLATQLVTRVYETLHVESPFAEFFEAPTVVHLAILITQLLAAQVPGTDLDGLLTAVEAEQPTRQ